MRGALCENRRKVKKNKSVDYAGTLDINLSGQVSYKDYRNLILGLSREGYRVSIGVVILVSGWVLALVYAMGNYDHESNKSHNHVFVLVFFPIMLIIILRRIIAALQQIKKDYQTNALLLGELNYRLTNDTIHIKGETVDSVQKWTRFYKIKETKSFFMFYQGEGIATLLDKKMFTDDELVDFRQFVGALNLKRV